jgi:hypothetical protein
MPFILFFLQINHPNKEILKEEFIFPKYISLPQKISPFKYTRRVEETKLEYKYNLIDGWTNSDSIP